MELDGDAQVYEGHLYGLRCRNGFTTPKSITHHRVQWSWREPSYSRSEPSAEAPNDASPFPTHILQLTCDPDAFISSSSRHAAMLLSPGRRFRLPLLPVDTPVALPYVETDVRFRFWDIAVGGEAERRAPARTDVVVSDWMSMITATTAAAASLNDEGNTRKCALATYTYYSVPYKLLWLQSFAVSGAERVSLLVASLSCEERLSVLHVPCHLPEDSTDTQPLREVGSLQLPRGVTPLEVAEAAQGLVAVGTAEHGLLLCGVEVPSDWSSTCADDEEAPTASVHMQILRCIHVCVPETPFFSITTIAVVGKLRASASGAGADDVASLLGPTCGLAFVCSSSYSDQSVTVRLTSGMMDDVAPESAAEVLCAWRHCVSGISFLSCLQIHDLVCLATPVHVSTCAMRSSKPVAAVHDSSVWTLNAGSRCVRPLVRFSDSPPIFDNSNSNGSYWFPAVTSSNELILFYTHGVTARIVGCYRLFDSPETADNGSGRLNLLTYPVSEEQRCVGCIVVEAANASLTLLLATHGDTLSLIRFFVASDEAVVSKKERLGIGVPVKKPERAKPPPRVRTPSGRPRGRPRKVVSDAESGSAVPVRKPRKTPAKKKAKDAAKDSDALFSDKPFRPTRRGAARGTGRGRARGGGRGGRGRSRSALDAVLQTWDSGSDSGSSETDTDSSESTDDDDDDDGLSFGSDSDSLEPPSKKRRTSRR